MIKYLAQRAFSNLIALFIFLTIIFFLSQLIIPTDFTTQFAMTMNREARDKLKQELGIDQPLWRQYLNWIQRLLQGDLGTSFGGQSVSAAFKELLPYTLLVFFAGTALSFSLGKWLGKVVAWRGPGIVSGTLTFTAVSLYTTFPPWLTFLVTYLFSRRLNWFTSPYKRGGGPFERVKQELWRDFIWTPQQLMLYMLLTWLVVWLLLFLADKLQERVSRKRLPWWLRLVFFIGGVWGSWQLLGCYPQAMDILSLAGLPILTYVLLSFGETMLIMRTSMVDTLQEEYISTAWAKGLPERKVRDKHAARNALLPVFSRLIVSLPYLLTGLVIIEKTFEWPGFSTALFDALYKQDMPLVMGGLLLVGVLSLLLRTLLDLVQIYLDPRIRYRLEEQGRL